MPLEQRVVELASYRNARLEPAGVEARAIVRDHSIPSQLGRARAEILRIALVAREWGCPVAASLGELARRIGVSKKTAERARSGLVGEGKIRLLPRFMRVDGAKLDLQRFKRAAPYLKRLELAPAIVLGPELAKQLRHARPRRNPLTRELAQLWRRLAKSGTIWTWHELRRKQRTATGAAPRRRLPVVVDDPRPRKPQQIRRTSFFGLCNTRVDSARGAPGVGAAAPPNIVPPTATSPDGSCRVRSPSSSAEPRKPASPAPRVKGAAAARAASTAATAAVARRAAPAAFSDGGDSSNNLREEVPNDASLMTNRPAPGGAQSHPPPGVHPRDQVLAWLSPHLASTIRKLDGES